MKKPYIFAGIVAASALIAAATVSSPFSSMGTERQPVAAAATQADDAYTIPYYTPAAQNSTTLAEGWTTINNNNDNKQWEPKSSSGNPGGTGYDAGVSYNTTLAGDDYFISPKIHFEANVEYVVVYNWKTASGVEKLSAYLSKSNASADAINADKITIHDAGAGKSTSSKYETVNEKVTLGEAGDYHIVFHFHSDKDKYTCYLSDVLVAKNEFAPAAPSKLTATAAAERELKCSLSWVLPTTDQFGATLTDDQTISAVKVYRDGAAEPIATLEGTATAFDDTEATGLTSGKHTYGVSVVVNDVEGPKAEVGPTDYVGPVVASPVPVQFNADTESDFNLWSQTKADGATSTAVWQFEKSYAMTGLNTSSGNYDHTLIAPPVMISEPGLYRISTALACNVNEAAGGGSVRLEYGANTDNNMTPIAGEEYFAVPYAKLGASLAEWPEIVTKDINIPAAGEYNFAIHAQGSGSIRYYVKYLGVEKTEVTPLAVTDLTAVAADDESNNIDVAWTNPTKTADGTDILEGFYTVCIYLNGAETPAATVTDGSESCRVAVDQPGVYEVAVKTAASATGATMPAFPTATTGWVGSKTVALPYSTDFAQTDGTKEIWEAVNANADDKLFVYEHSEGYSPYDRYAISGTKTFNDYVLSPLFDLEPGFYKITITHKGGSYSSHLTGLTLGIAKKGAFDASASDLGLTASTKFADFYASSNKEDNFIFHIDEAGKYQAAYGLNETTGYNTAAELHAFKIEAVEAYPDNVADLTATVNADDDHTIDLSWTNPTKCYGTDFDLEEIESIVIKRDDEVVATLTDNLTPGAAAEYQDADVPNGPHTYTVYATLNGKTHDGDLASVFVAWVGGGVSAPVSFKGVFPGWHSDEGWVYKENSNVENSYWHYPEESATATHDSHLISCPLNIKEKEIYLLEFECSGSNVAPKADNPVAVKMGTDANHRNFKQIGTLLIPTDRSSYTYEKHQMYVAVGDTDEPTPAIMLMADGEPTPEQLYAKAAKVDAGDNVMAIHLTNPGNTKIKSFNFTKVADYDYAATGIQEITESGISFNGSEVSFNGTAAVEVYNLAGACVASAPAACGNYNIASLGAGFYLVKVTAGSETTTLKVTIK